MLITQKTAFSNDRNQKLEIFVNKIQDADAILEPWVRGYTFLEGKSTRRNTERSMNFWKRTKKEVPVSGTWSGTHDADVYPGAFLEPDLQPSSGIG